MAEQLATIVELREIPAVGVTEFSVHAKGQELKLGGDLGWLGAYCAEKLRGRLAERAWRGGGEFQIVAADALNDALDARSVGPDDLRTVAVKGIEVGGQRPALLQGILRSRIERVLTIQCSLLGTEGVQPIYGTVGGTARLNDGEWPMLSGSPSGTLPPDIYQPEAPTVDNPKPESDMDQVTGWLDEHSNGPHPLLDPNYPFRVSIIVGGRPRELVFGGANSRRCYVGLRKGEVYKVRIELGEQIEAPVYMQLFIDGRNTLPEKVPVYKGVRVEPVFRELPAQRVSPANAKAWRLDPARSRVFVVEGFFSRTGEEGEYREFLVGEAPRSLGPRERFSDQPGMITAAFYALRGGPRGPRGGKVPFTVPGAARRRSIPLYEPTPLGKLRGVVQIHYVYPEALDQAREAPSQRARSTTNSRR